jgi:outer membrane protein assembly factor BamB
LNFSQVKAADPKTVFVTQGRIFVGCENGFVQIRDARTGKLLIKTNIHNDLIYALAVSEGKVYTGSYDKTMKIWDYELYHVKNIFNLKK